MFGFGIWELLIVLVIVLLIFGPKRLKSIGSDLGSAIKGFRTAVKDDEAEKNEKEKDERLIEGEVDSNKASQYTEREKQQDRQ
jgi:sec-independent protein translocase protein TatA